MRKICFSLLLKLSLGLIEVLQGDILGLLTGEHVLELANDPLFILKRGRRVPSIQGVEFDTASITTTSVKNLVIIVTNLVERLQAPC